MRGEARRGREESRVVRITPAHAGRRNSALVRSVASKDHPRACGEKRWKTDVGNYRQGSPPRMRGEGFGKAHHEGVVGITPAHAGRSAGGRCSPAPRKDHPRACGEKLCCAFSPYRSTGSPPRMRGEAYAAESVTMAFRITPAHAGRSFPFQLTRSAIKGSPPRMRGEVTLQKYAKAVPRITPAHAGRRRDLHVTPVIGEDHPRACGEKKT